MQILSNPISALNVRKSPKFSWSLGNQGNTMVTSDFRPEVEIWPFRACAIKNTQYNANLWPIRLNFRVLKEIGHNYRNSSFIVDMAMGQIPRSTERIASYEWNSTTLHATINVCSQCICCVWQESTQHPPLRDMNSSAQHLLHGESHRGIGLRYWDSSYGQSQG